MNAILFAAALLAAPQQKPVIPSAGETIEVSLVNLDVFVTDKSGQRVHGLTKEDFEVLENGKLQPITNFAEYANESTLTLQTPGSPAVVAPRQTRTIVVFVERFALPKPQAKTFFDSIKKLLNDAIRPGDRAMVVTWNRGLLLTEQGFTDALPSLDHALDRVAALTVVPMQDLRDDIDWSIAFSRSVEGASSGNGLAGMNIDYYAQLEKTSQLQKVRSLNAVIRSIAADQGKKILLLITHRLSREAGGEIYWRNEQNGGRLGPLDTENRAAIDMSNALKTIDDTANANGVTMYPMFPEGLDNALTDPTGPNFGYRELNNEMHALREIAEETGGLTAAGTDTLKLIPKVGDDLDSYYSIAYRVRNSGADKARKVVVKTKDPSLTVRSRRAFVEKSDQTRSEDRVIAALFNNPPSGGLPLNVVVGERLTHGKKFTLPLTIHVPIAALTQLPQQGKFAGAFSVYFAWGGRLGGLSDTSHETRNYTIPAADITKARAQGHLTYKIDLAVDANTERIAFGVFDEISKDFALRLMDLRR